MKKIVEIFELCLEISNTTEHDVFFEYSPHVNCFSVNYYINGWESGEDIYVGANNIGTYYQIKLTNTYKIKEVIAELNQLKDIK